MANMQTDPNMYQDSLNVREKISSKKRIGSEILNLLFILLATMLIFSTVGKKMVIPKFGMEYIDNINVIFTDLAKAEDYPTTVTTNYGFIDIDEDLYMEAYIKDNAESKELAYEKYLEARIDILTKVRADESFKLNNAKFNALHMFTYFLSVFIPLFIFEFLIPVFDKKSRTLGMKFYKSEMVNSNNNQNPNKMKLILRFFIILLFEHTLIRLFFGNSYFIIIILLDVIFVYVTKDKVLLHDLLSTTKVIDSKYAGIREI